MLPQITEIILIKKPLVDAETKLSGLHIHSTDTFGLSELVFGVSHLLGFSYAPRFKNLKRQRLYIFKSRRGLDRSAWKIKPTAYIDEELAIQHWDDILALDRDHQAEGSDGFRSLSPSQLAVKIPKLLILRHRSFRMSLRSSTQTSFDRGRFLGPGRAHVRAMGYGLRMDLS
jgi:hypothetical protein